MLSAKKAYLINQIVKKVRELEAKGKIKDAVTEVQKAIELNPQDGNLYNRLGDLYIKSGKIKESIEAYKYGVEAFRQDNYFRNALALSKKILRYDPDNLDIYFSIGELLFELDEKNDALTYLFEYVEKQIAQKNEKGALKAAEFLNALGVMDEKIVGRISEIYKKFGEDNAAQEFLKALTSTKKFDAEKFNEAPIVEKTRSRNVPVEADGGRIKEDLNQLDESMRQVEKAVSELRKAMRLDEVILALDKSLTALSDEQKKSIDHLQKSISGNLSSLEKSIKEIYSSSGKNIRELEILLNNLSKALASLSANQASFANALSNNLEKLGKDFDKTTEKSLEVVKSILVNYKTVTEEMCIKLDETKDTNTSFIQVTREMKVDLRGMIDSMAKFLIAQEQKEQKRDRYMTIIIAIIGVICGLFILSIIIK